MIRQHSSYLIRDQEKLPPLSDPHIPNSVPIINLLVLPPRQSDVYIGILGRFDVISVNTGEIESTAVSDL